MKSQHMSNNYKIMMIAMWPSKEVQAEDGKLSSRLEWPKMSDKMIPTYMYSPPYQVRQNSNLARA